jgi:hypothetical protein
MSSDQNIQALAGIIRFNHNDCYSAQVREKAAEAAKQAEEDNACERTV